jgi:hypothetical protein
LVSYVSKVQLIARRMETTQFVSKHAVGLSAVGQLIDVRRWRGIVL